MAEINFLEKDLETIIENTSPQKLTERGLPTPDGSIFIRQERIGEYGFMDLVNIYAHRHGDNEYKSIKIFELKQNEINTAALIQLSRYLRGVEHFLGTDINLTGVLIGKTIDLKSDFIYLSAQCWHIGIYTYSLDIDGFKFTQIFPQSYSLIKPGNAEDFINNVDYHFRRMLEVNQVETDTTELPY